MATNIFQDATKSIPKSDSQINRVDFTKSEIGARPSHLPKSVKNGNTISHVGK
ncbi:hypothetical protein KGP36_06120 [Patescibacteria group bacterium]|nr:hypothetical protein [Patescibacteria group bacterium]